jgi:hypothetical protein
MGSASSVKICPTDSVNQRQCGCAGDPYCHRKGNPEYENHCDDSYFNTKEVDISYRPISNVSPLLSPK